MKRFIYDYAECHFTECHYVECRVLFTIKLNVIFLNVIMLNVIMLSVIAPKNKLECSLTGLSNQILCLRAWRGNYP
jgi:hypothetical protein